MKTYPTIPKQVQKSQPIYAFDKFDGSNIRAEWSRKRGFYKYGTRTRLVEATEKPLGWAIQLINDIYGIELSKKLKDTYIDSAVCYFEFYGAHSFAGFHEENDDFNVILFDISLFKRGFLSPKDFMKFTRGLTIPKMLYYGNANQPFVNSVINSTLSNMTYEGVVCKYEKKKIFKLFKIKSQAWLDKLKNFCGNNEEKFRQLG